MPGSAGKDRPGSRVNPRQRAALLLPALSLTAALAGCSIDYQGASVDEQAPAGIPDTVAIGLLHRIHKDGRLSLELDAARAETYNAKSTTILTDARPLADIVAHVLRAYRREAVEWARERAQREKRKAES